MANCVMGEYFDDPNDIIFTLWSFKETVVGCAALAVKPTPATVLACLIGIADNVNEYFDCLRDCKEDPCSKIIRLPTSSDPFDAICEDGSYCVRSISTDLHQILTPGAAIEFILGAECRECPKVELLGNGNIAITSPPPNPNSFYEQYDPIFDNPIEIPHASLYSIEVNDVPIIEGSISGNTENFVPFNVYDDLSASFGSEICITITGDVGMEECFTEKCFTIGCPEIEISLGYHIPTWIGFEVSGSSSSIPSQMTYHFTDSSGEVNEEGTLSNYGGLSFPSIDIKVGETYCLTVNSFQTGTNSHMLECTVEECYTVEYCDLPEHHHEIKITDVVPESGFGENDGSIHFSLAGFWPQNEPHTVQWSNGVTSEPTTWGNYSLNELGTGTYCVTVTNVNGCSATACEDIVIQDCSNEEFTEGSSNRCIIPVELVVQESNIPGGLSDISINVQGSIGTQFYAYWDDLDQSTTGLTRSDVYSGEYCVTVYSDNCCVGNACITVENTCNNMPTILKSINNPCGSNSGDGSISLNVLGANIPVSFHWETGETGGSIDGLDEGTYTVYVVYGEQNCIKALSFDLKGDLSYSNDFNTAEIKGVCKKNNSDVIHGEGSIKLKPVSWNNDYTYAWSNGATSASIEGLDEGTYTVTITDSNGCSITESFEIASGGYYTCITSPNGTDYSCLEKCYCNGTLVSENTSGTPETGPIQYGNSRCWADLICGSTVIGTSPKYFYKKVFWWAHEHGELYGNSNAPCRLLYVCLVDNSVSHYVDQDAKPKPYELGMCKVYCENPWFGGFYNIETPFLEPCTNEGCCNLTTPCNHTTISEISHSDANALLVTGIDENSNTAYSAMYDYNGNLLSSPLYFKGFQNIFYSPIADNSNSIVGTYSDKAFEDFSYFEESFAGETDIFIVKLGEDGFEEWYLSIGSQGEDYVESSVTDSKGNTYLAGYYAEDKPPFDKNSKFLIQIDSNGSVTGFASPFSVDDKITLKSIDNKVYALASTKDRIRVFSFDSIGNSNILYNSSIENTSVYFDVNENEEIGIVVNQNSNQSQILMLKNGEVSSKRILSSSKNIDITGMAVDNEGIYIGGTLAGVLSSGEFSISSNGNDIFIIKLDKNGAIVSGKTEGGEGNQSLSNLILTKNGVFYTGTIDEIKTIIEGQEMWYDEDPCFLVELDEKDEEINIKNNSDLEEINPSTISVYPNPFDTEIVIDITTDNEQEILIELISTDGKNIISRESSILKGKNQVRLDVDKKISTGVYLLKIEYEDGTIYSERIVH